MPESDIERIVRVRGTIDPQEITERRLVALLREQEARQRRIELMDRYGNDDDE